MKEQLVLLTGELGKLISSDVFEDGRSNIYVGDQSGEEAL